MTGVRIGAGAGKALAAILVLLGLGARAPSSSAAPASTACFVGQTRRNTDFAGDDWTNFTVYQLLDPASCAACGGAPLVLNQVIWWIRFHTAAVCPITFEVTIVASDHAACPRPDDSIVLCPSVTHVYQPTGSPPFFATVPLPAGCCIAEPAFVRVRIVDTGGCGITLGLGMGQCAGPCLSYTTGPEYPFQDSCDLFGVAPSINVAADCCTPTPARPRSWGGLKLIYR